MLLFIKGNIPWICQIGLIRLFTKRKLSLNRILISKRFHQHKISAIKNNYRLQWNGCYGALSHEFWDTMDFSTKMLWMLLCVMWMSTFKNTNHIISLSTRWYWIKRLKHMLLKSSFSFDRHLLCIYLSTGVQIRSIDLDLKRINRVKLSSFVF